MGRINGGESKLCKCKNSSCEKEFYRRPYQVARGQDRFCSRACAGTGVKKTSINQACTLCGKEVERAAHQADAKTPFCSNFCANLYQSHKRALDQLIWTPELLLLMMEYKGDGCAAPGCDEPQETRNRKNSRNRYHACTGHLDRIESSLRLRSSKRRRHLQDQDNDNLLESEG